MNPSIFFQDQAFDNNTEGTFEFRIIAESSLKQNNTRDKWFLNEKNKFI